MRRSYLSVFLLAAVTLTGCDALLAPSDDPGSGTGKVLGLVEITLSVEGAAGKSGQSVTATASSDLNPVPGGGLQLVAFSNGSFTYGGRASGGVRYMWATFKVRNATSAGVAYPDVRRNLTFVAVTTAGAINQTAISRMNRFDGTAAAPGIALSIVPTGAVTQDPAGEVVPRFPDALQVFTEEEVAAIVKPAGVVSVLPYGFVVNHRRNPASRTLAANPAPDQFDGVVTFAFKAPLQSASTADPFTVSTLFMMVEDTETRLTQSPEEQGPFGTLAADLRAALLGATGMTLLPGGGARADAAATRLICSVRTAGTEAAPLAYMFPPPGAAGWLIPKPNRAGPQWLPTSTNFQAGQCGTFSAPSATSFVVQGSQSGRRFIGESYLGDATSLVSSPTGTFFPGEEVEVVLTDALGISRGLVGRYRTRSGVASGVFGTFPGGAPAVGGNPISVRLADVNRDGRLDLVTANYGSHSVSVALGTGAGSFGASTAFPVAGGVGSQPFTVAVRDVNRDGNLDLLTANSGTNNVSVLLGNGTGTFVAAPGSPFAVGGSPLSIATGDLNADGSPDLVTANHNTNQVAVLLGSAAGGFTPASGSPYATGAKPSFVALGDLNGDDRLDVVTVNYTSNDLTVLLGDGSGGFTAASGNSVAVGSAPRSAALGDVNGDGALDVVVANYGSDDLSVLPGDGSGGFLPSSSPVSSQGDGPAFVLLADVNGDGRLDIIAANSDANRVVVRFGDGLGGFPSCHPYVTGATPSALAAGDLNGDGLIDLVSANYSSNNVSLLRNN